MSHGGGRGGAQVASAARSELVHFFTLPLCNCGSSLPYQALWGLDKTVQLNLGSGC